MKNRDRYERIRQVHLERSMEAERRAASLAITRAARAQTDAEKQAEQLRLQAQQIRRHADTVLDRLAERGLPDMVTVNVRRTGRFRIQRDEQEPAWHLADVDVAYKIQGDDQTATDRYYLLADGAIAKAPGQKGSWGATIPTGVLPPESIVQNDAVHIALLRGLRALGGSPEIF